jgi:hypothetical protein
MNRILMFVAASILTVAFLAGVVNARNANTAMVIKPNLENVRGFASGVSDKTYAIDGGVLFVGGPHGWAKVTTPDDIIVGAVAIDQQHPETVYVGAANALTLYRTTDNGATWLRVPLTNDYVGGVTNIAVDSDQRLVYVGTDTAGLFRLRDVGSSMVLGGHFQLDEPVIEVAADSTGTGMVFARTQSELYRAESYGLNWTPVTNLGGAPTAVVIANTEPATVYVGTSDVGLLKSTDGLNWTPANAGLGYVPGSRLEVDALAIDSQQPQVLYVATSYLYGTSELHQSPVGVAMSTDGGQNWATLYTDHKVAVTDLMPVSGQTGAVYALTDVSRMPQPLGTAPAAPASLADVQVASPITAVPWTSVIAWVVAGLAALALGYAVWNDLRNRRPTSSRPLTNGTAHRS